MAKYCYIPRRFKEPTLALIKEINEICEEYTAQGFDLTVRQVFYQHVSRGWCENTQRNYNRLKDVAKHGRLAGRIDWDHIVDRTRRSRSLPHWDDPADAIETTVGMYAIDKWADQPAHVEVWIEKDALVGVIESVCRGLDVTFCSCRGFTSTSYAWRAAKRMVQHSRGGQECVILHLSDHDPSGLAMTRDLQERMDIFTGPLHRVKVERVALTMDQIEEYGPPPNWAKQTDSRYASYADEYGDQSWELDALEPVVIVDLIQSWIEMYIDFERWNEAGNREEEQRELLGKVAANWNRIVNWLNGEQSNE